MEGSSSSVGAFVSRWVVKEKEISEDVLLMLSLRSQASYLKLQHEGEAAGCGRVV